MKKITSVLLLTGAILTIPAAFAVRENLNLTTQTPAQMQENMSLEWRTYLQAHNKDFNGIHYPKNFYVKELQEDGPMLVIQSGPGIMLLPQEKNECVYDHCNIVDKGLRIMIGIHDKSELPSEEKTWKEIQPGLKEAHDVKSIDTMYEPVNLQAA